MASTYLTRTQESSANSQIFTYSTWVKRSGITGAKQEMVSGGSASTDFDMFYFDASERLSYYSKTSNSENLDLATSRKFRDTSAWYHIVLSVDTTQGTASNRVKLYVNGVLETAYDTSTYPSVNTNLFLNKANQSQIIGRQAYSAVDYFDGSMSHINFIDGTVYDATAFGEYDANGVWKIKTSPSVTYGTNGFFILKDGNSVTDQSGNGNNFTVGGGTLTNTEDSPSNVFNVLNAVSNPPNGYTLSNGNLEATVSGQSFVRQFIANTIAPTSGKWYWESKLITSGGSDRSRLGICSYEENIGTGTTVPQNELSIATGSSRIRFTENGSTTEVDGFFTIPSANDIFMYALDLDNTKFYFGINGNWWNYNTAETGGDPTSGSGYVTNSTNIIKGAMSLLINVQAGAAATTFTNQFNFGNGYFGTTPVSSAGTNASGNGIFEYDVPTGYTALSTKGVNL